MTGKRQTKLSLHRLDHLQPVRVRVIQNALPIVIPIMHLTISPSTSIHWVYGPCCAAISAIPAPHAEEPTEDAL